MRFARSLNPPRHVVLAALLAASVLSMLTAIVGAQAAKADRASLWRDRVIAIDGSDEDWKGLTSPVKNAHVALGFVNDGDWIYVCLLAKHDETRTQIAAQGLTVWLDAADGKKNTFGVRFPSEEQLRARALERPDESAGGWNEIDVVGPGRSKARRVPLTQAGGIEVRAAIIADVLVYELKVPLVLSEAHAYAVGAVPGDVVRATFETPEYRGPYPRASRFPGGSIGVTVGGRGTIVGGGVAGGIPMGRVPGIPSPLSVQTTVKLAAR